jgi:hypothetical protein
MLRSVPPRHMRSGHALGKITVAADTERPLSLTLSVILKTVGASRWKIVWSPADCRRPV